MLCVIICLVYGGLKVYDELRMAVGLSFSIGLSPNHHSPKPKSVSS
jgi:hypothetical protein